MNEKLFSEAMGELSDKYITEAINYKGKKKEQKNFYLVKRCAAVWGWVRELANENHYKYFFEGDAAGTKEEESGTLKYTPGWLPEGTEYVTTIEEVGGEILYRWSGIYSKISNR